jgi:adenylate cyclase
LDWVEGHTYDWRLRLLAPPPGQLSSEAPVAIVAVDEETLTRYGSWPLPRSVYARLLGLLGDEGAAVVGFDLLLSEPDRAGPDGDAALAKAIADGPPVVLGMAGATMASRGLGPVVLKKPWSDPLPLFVGHGAQVGHLLAAPDPDGVLRSLPLQVETERGPQDAFSALVARRVPGAGPQVLKSLIEPRLLLDFRQGPIPTYSLAQVLERATPRGAFRGRAVVVGATAPGLPDRYATPLSGTGGLWPGVRLQALAVLTLLQGGLRVVGPGLVAALTLAAAAFGVAVPNAGRRATAWGIAGLVGLAVVGLVAAAAGWWVSLTPAAVALVAGASLSLTWSLASTREERIRLRRTMDRYLTPEVQRKLPEDTLDADPARERVRLALLFADLRGFTAFSLAEGPERTAAMLDRYLSLMVEAVHSQGGTVDKFLGDGILALFRAGPGYRDDCRAAVQAACELLTRVETTAAESLEEGRDALGVGVGVASGEVIVGSVGSAVRADFTVIGDAVNLASRLQRLAQAGEVVCDAGTWAAAGVRCPGGELDEWVHIEGWENPQRVVRAFCDGGHSRERGVELN